MQIRDLIAHPLVCELREPFSYSQRWFQKRSALLVKVVTDEGLVGWGECFCHDAWPAVATILERVLKPQVVRMDPLARSVIWEKLYNWTRDYGQKGLTASALSGLDIALWDIAGKATGLPISQLLGGNFRDRVQVYATGLYRTEAAMRDLSLLAREAERYVDQGFRAVKMKVGFGLQEDLARVRTVREAIGPGVGLMVDANHAYDASTAIALGRMLEPYDIGWFEEPVVPEDREGYRRVRDALSIPIAGGEAEFTRYGFRDLLDGGCVDIAQPDLCICGGISEGLKIATLCQVHGTRCIPHMWGTGIAFAAALHFVAALPDQPPCLHPTPLMLEYDRTENPLRDESLATPIEVHDGLATVPTGPGLGVAVNEDTLHRYAIK